MKKKVLALLLAMAMIFLLCGCDALDNLRQQRAGYEGENIVHQGVTYMKLPICPALNPEVDHASYVYVVEPDVPLLLIDSFYEERFYQSEDGNFLVPYYGEILYCREDMHADLSKTITEGWEYTKVYYEYTVYIDEESWEYEYRRYDLTKEQIEALEFLTKNVEPKNLSEGMYLQSDWGLRLYECSEDELFKRSNSRIAVAGSTYYLVLDERTAFEVPEGMASVFDDITKPIRTAYDYPEPDRTT